MQKLTTTEIEQLKNLLARLDDQISGDVAHADEETSRKAWDALTGTIAAKLTYIETAS